MSKYITVLLLLSSLRLAAQDSLAKNPLQITGYVEAFYLYDFGQPSSGNRPSFVYSHNRHQEFNLNLGFIKANYQTNQVRANLALATGTYMNANYAAEPGVLKNIFEANVGVRLSKHRNLWLDAGILPSHIGFESAISKDCWNLTRGILADNSPYFESGIKLSYTTPNDQWTMSALVLNGWQRIQRPPGNSTLAFGHQLTFKPSANVLVNSSSFIGSDKPDSIRQMRYFHNLYGIFQLSEKVGLTVGFDLGAEQQSKGSKKLNVWYTPNIILRLKTSSKTFIAFRGEHYNDQYGVMIPTNTPNGFQTWGYSANFDYAIQPNLLWRIEARGFEGKDATFEKNKQPSKHNFLLATSLAVSF